MPKGQRQRLRDWVLAGLAIVALVVAFALIPIPGGDDWETFYGGSQRVWKGLPLYGERITHSHYYNPPWLAVLMVPLSLLPFRWGWALLSVASLVAVAAVMRRDDDRG